MKIRCILIFLYIISFPVFAQTEIAPGALDNLSGLLNKPAFANPAKAIPIEKNWYTVYLDSHVFTDQVSFKQITSVLSDIENYTNIFDGKSTKLRTNIIRRENNETIVDITSITITFIRFTLNYRASSKILENTDTKYISEVRQIDNETNDQQRKYHLIRYIEEVTINEKKYVYIRLFSTNDTYIGIKLSNIPNMIIKNADNSNNNILNMIIEAARGR